MDKQIELKNLSLIELQALAYRLIVDSEKVASDLQKVNQFIANNSIQPQEMSKPAEVKPQDVPEKKPKESK